MERCKDILQTHNWDIEVAVQDTLNIREGTPSVYNPPLSVPPPVVNHPADQRVYYASPALRSQGILGWSYFLLTFPFNFIYNSILSLLRFSLNLIRSDPRRFVTDPIGDVTNFISKYEESYGKCHPVFYQGTYSQALNDAKRELKFLLVYLHGDDHQDTPYFCRSTLSNKEVIEFINTNMLFWACSITYPEGYRVSQALRENTYPFLAMIVLRENRMTVVARLEGPSEPQELLQRLLQIISDNEGSLIAARLERQERSLNQTLRQQQDEAYAASLRADQEKERRRQEERDKRELEEKARRESLLAEQRRKEEIRRQKIELADQIPEEPSVDQPDTVHVMIKLPVGTRLERRFRQNHSLKYLYYFIFCHDESPDFFQVVTNFPRKVLPCQPTPDQPDPPTFAEVGLGRSEMLFVHDLEA